MQIGPQMRMDRTLIFYRGGKKFLHASTVPVLRLRELHGVSVNTSFPFVPFVCDEADPEHGIVAFWWSEDCN